MTGISEQSLHRGPGAEPIVGGPGEGEGTKHVHTCQSILLAILFKNVLTML